MRIMVTGGGTGGHTSPALAVIEELQKRDPRLTLQWVGRKGGIEDRLCASLSIPFRSVPAEAWPRGKRVRKLWAAGKLGCGIARSILLVKKFQPQVVLGVGGYVSVPLVWAAQRLGVATVLHEQNKRLGMANRVLAGRATRILLSYPDTVGDYPREHARTVGNPVRAGFYDPPDKRAARAALGLDEAIPVVLVTGGSQGAHSLNAAMAAALPEFGPREAQFLWMTGPADVQEARRAATDARVRADVFAFIEDMVTACCAADVIVSRAGASSTAEIAALGKPSVLVPYPHATDNHQEQNARAFEQAGAAVVLLDGECTGDRLVTELRRLIGDPSRLEAMGAAAATLARPGAAEAIVEEIFALAFGEINAAGG